MEQMIEVFELGLKIAIHQKGPIGQKQSKGDILMIHGIGCSKESFNEAFSCGLFDDYRIIAVDLPGFGASSKPADASYTMQFQADCLMHLCHLINIQSPIIVGHSMGGAVALLLIQLLPAVKYFISFEGNLVDDDCSISRETANLSEQQFLTVQYLKDPMIYRCRRREIDPAPDPVAFYKSAVSLVAHSDSGDLLNQYLNLPFPKAYFYGAENRELKTVSCLAGEDMIEVPGCGHFMMNDNPEMTYSEMANRMNKIDG